MSLFRINNIYEHFKKISIKLQINSQIIIAYHTKKWLVRVRARRAAKEKAEKEAKEANNKNSKNRRESKVVSSARPSQLNTQRTATGKGTSTKNSLKSKSSAHGGDSVAVTPKNAAVLDNKSVNSHNASAKDLGTA